MNLKPFLNFCFLAVLLSNVSSYADTAGPTFTSGITQLNSATTSGDQINPSIASLPGNQFVMTWSDRASNDGDRGGIFGRIYDETLTPITSEFLVNTLTSDWQSKSNVASASNGNFMAIWHQSNGYVEGQIFNASGDKLGSQFTVQEGFNGLSDVVADSAGNFWVVSTVNNGSGYINKYSNTGELLVDSKVYQSDVVAFDPVITALSDDRILIGWYDGQNTSGSDIYGQFVTAAGELDGDPFMVNTTLAENQSSQAIAGLSSGGFVVTWQSLLQDGDLAGVYARVFDKAGVGGSEIAVNTLTSGNQVKSYVTARSDGGFVVGWVDAKAPQQVYVQSYAADGTAQGANQAVSIDDVLTVNDSTNIEFTELTDGSLVAAWDAWKGSRNIYGRAFNVQSDVVDPPVVEPPSKRIGFTSGITQLNSATTSGDQINPSIASLPGNQFVMTWSDRASNDGDRGGIFGRIYDETLTPITSEFLVNTLTSDWQSKSNVASASNGNFMAIWHQSNGYVEGQIFNASGDKLGSQFTVQEGFNGLSDVVADSAGNFWVVSTVNNGSGYINKYSNTGELLVDSKVYQSDVVAFDPVITALSDDRILIGWYDGQNTSGSDIYGQFVTAAGELDGDPFMVNTTLAENQSSQAIAGLSSGGFVVTWQSLLQDGDLAGVYARVFDKAGVGGSEIAVNTLTSGNQVKSYVTARSDGGFVVGWVDAKAPQQVYVQSYAADGTAQGANQAVSIDDVLTVNDSTNIEFTELTDGSLVAAWDAWKGSRNIYGRTFELNAIVGTEDDSDGDGVLDINDAFPNDPSETADTDGDGIGNNVDPDDDGDDVLDINDAFELISLDGRIDTDGDGYPNDCDAVCEQIGMVADTDDDADGVLDADDAFPLDSTESIDADGDGIGANTDFDDNDPAVGISAQLGPTFTSGITQLNSATTSGDQINPSIASLPGNQFVMTWSDRASNDGDRGGIFGRIYDETLTPITSEFLVNTLTSDWQSKSNVASASNGNFMAIWHQSNGYVEGQIFNASGDKLGSQFTVQEGFNGLSDVVADSAGNFWVVSTVNNGSGYINKYSNTGELLVDSKVYQSDVVAFDPVITALSDDRILIGWYDGQNTSGSDIYGQFVTAAGELDGDPFMVNTTLAENQSSQAIAGLSSGGFVVTWQSLLQDGDLAGVYARVFDKAGVGGSEIAVNTLTSGNQVKSYVTARSDGGFVVGWVDAKAPQQVYVQSYAADGTAQGANQAVSIDDVLTVNDSTNIEFTELTDGSLVAAWDAWKGSRNIYGRAFNVQSDVVDPPVVEPPSKRIGFTSGITQLNSATTSGDQINPSIASLPGNQFVMTWSDRASNDGDRGGIFGRIYDETLTPITSEFLVNTLTSDWQSKSNVASASNGNFMAIWHQSNGYVEGQIFNASGDKLGSQFTVQEGFNGLSDVVADSAGNFWVVSTVNNGSGYINKYSNTGELLVDSKVYQSDVVAFDPVITALSDDRILIGWYDGQNTSGSDIYGQFVTAAGELDGDPFMVNTTLAENQSSQAIAGLSSGGFVVTWQSLLQDGDLAGVYARVFDKAGVGGSEIAVNTLTSGNQVKSYVTARSDGGFVVGWVDAKAPQQVYVQSYAADGTAQGANQAVSIDDVLTVNDSTNIEFTELTDGSLVAAWDAWKGSRNIYGRTFELNAIVGTEDDSDGDGVLDINDAFPNDPSETADTDGDGLGDSADVYPDDPRYQLDSDFDGMPDAWEITYGLNPNDSSDAFSDLNNDGTYNYAEFIAGAAPAGSLDIDGNGQYDALTDGLLLLRGMFLLSGDSLISDAVASDAAYKTSDEVASRIEMLGDLVDIDGNGNIDALTDGLVILRYLFNLRGDVLISDVIASDATVETSEQVEAKIEALLPAV